MSISSLLGLEPFERFLFCLVILWLRYLDVAMKRRVELRAILSAAKNIPQGVLIHVKQVQQTVSLVEKCVDVL